MDIKSQQKFRLYSVESDFTSKEIVIENCSNL